MNRGVCSVVPLILLLLVGCGDTCSGKRVSSQRHVVSVSDALDSVVMAGSSTAALPRLPNGQILLIANPYAITDDWLQSNTPLAQKQRHFLVDLSNGREDVLVAVLSQECVIEHGWLSSRFTIGDESILKIEKDGQIVLVTSEGEHRPIKLFKAQ